MNEIEQMCREHFNEPVLLVFNLARLIGYGEDADDCYLIVKYPYPRGVVWHTAVGGYTFLNILKGQNKVMAAYPEFEGEYYDDFNRLDTMLELNGAEKEKEFKVEMRTDERALSPEAFKRSNDNERT